ncbi:hypothetical protein FisN_28Hh021 [Fistulifera solaris]|uniref:G-protein coupled receptors family 3 profile domain-containing protein n=1 Tax=Fistulifera solaris TaxID=1519565 RepID=A0A1Z5KGX7_FISSO|nr:hypothetical protein FisN_28Hh021 [Fistulifera solaris]|eukprot:GAX25553.1 hypothetical protein FisN_28Hh021 [Fistulifera solaris]
MNHYLNTIVRICAFLLYLRGNRGADRELQVLEGLFPEQKDDTALTGPVDFVVVDAAQTPVFGTMNGYDKGGDDALCFESSFPFNGSRSDLLEMDYLDQQLFDGVGTATLLPTCYEGTDLLVGNLKSRDTLVEVEDQPTMFWNQVYTVSMNMSMYVPAVSFNAAFVPVEHVHFRLLWCDAVQTGFCNPLQDIRGNNHTSESANHSTMYQGEVLDGIPSTDDFVFVYTPWAKVKVETYGNGTITSSVNLKVTCPSWKRKHKRPRAFFVIAQVLVASNDLETSTARRIDIAQTIPDRVLYVQPQPEILSVTKSTKIFLCVVVGLGSAVAMFCFGVIVYHQKHPVMLLAQGNLLALLTLVCFLQMFFTFTVLPTRDAFCRISFPLLQTLLSAIGAILVGRIWRIYSTLSAVNTLGKFKEKPKGERYVVSALDCLASLSGCLVQDKAGRRQSSQSLRRTVTAQETFFLICILILPQACLQIVGSFIFDDSLITQLDDHDIVGRVVCEGKPLYFLFVTYLWTCFLFFATVLMAWFSRDLPSAFNEKDQIFNAASCGAIISAMSVALGRLLDEPTVTPDVVVILSALVYYGLAMITLILLIWPKVGRVLFGGKVVMSRLLGSRSDSSESKVSTLSSPVSGITTGTSSVTNSLTLQAGDPLPGVVERKIFSVSTLLKSTLNNR